MFLAPAYTFDNVKGKFPIGFKIWSTSSISDFRNITADVYDESGFKITEKEVFSVDKSQYINKWISIYKSTSSNSIGYLDGINGNDFQHNNIVYILNSKNQLPNPRGIWINSSNAIAIFVYYAVRHCIEANWLNDRDQFLFPNDAWLQDSMFQCDCLCFLCLIIKFNQNMVQTTGSHSRKKKSMLGEI